MKHVHAPEDHESVLGTCRTRIRAGHMQDTGQTRSSRVRLGSTQLTMATRSTELPDSVRTRLASGL